MTTSSKVQRTAAVAVLAFVGCAFPTESSELDAVGSNSDMPAAGSPIWAPDAHIVTSGARLIRPFAESARDSICVSYDDAVPKAVAIDEFECTTVSEPYGNGWVQMCGSCIMEFRDARDGSLFLAARRDERCQVFAGTYLVTSTSTAGACGAPPPPNVTLFETCALGGNGKAECASEPPGYQQGYPSPWEQQY